MSSLTNFIDPIYREAIVWCKGKDWSWRLPILLWFAYVLIRHLFNPDYSSILGPVNLGIHELGHLVFAPFGKFIGILGGTLLQLLAPAFLAVNFYRQKDFFAIVLCFGWLSTNLFGIARYVADARSMSLPLVTPFPVETVIHDWNYLLGQLGVLKFEKALAFFIESLAVISMLICLLVGGSFLCVMYESRKRREA